MTAFCDLYVYEMVTVHFYFFTVLSVTFVTVTYRKLETLSRGSNVFYISGL